MQFGPRTLLFVMLLLAMPIAAYLMLFKPLNSDRDEARADTARKTQKLGDLEKAMAYTKDMPAEIERLEKAIKVMEEKLPPEDDMDKVLQEVWKAAKENRLNVTSVRNQKTVLGASYSEQPIRIVIKGAFNPGFFKFLSQVENLQRLTKINEMKIDPDPDVNGAVVADFILTIFFESSEKVVVAQ